MIKNQKNSFTGKISKLKNCKNDQKKDQKCFVFFFGPRGPNFDPFSQFFASRYCPKKSY